MLTRTNQIDAEYKIDAIFPVDVLLFMAYFKQWPVSIKKTKVCFVPKNYHSVNYVEPFKVTDYMVSEASLVEPRRQQVLTAEMLKITDADCHNTWIVGYAPEIDTLYIGMSKDGYIVTER